MKSSKKTKNKLPMSLTKKVVLTILGIAAIAAVIWLLYYVIHYVSYNKYRDYLSSYEYEQGREYAPISEASSDVAGMELVCENEFLKLYTDTAAASIAVYDKRDGSVTYSNPPDSDNDSIANASIKNYMKSQFILSYYNSDVISGNMDSFSQSVAKGQFRMEGIENGIRYIYRVGDITNNNGVEAISFEIPLEYRLNGDALDVSIPVSGITEYGNGAVYRIQLLNYMGAAGNTEDGYIVVPNASGSLINFNNGKTSSAAYSQYIYDIDPLAANYTTTENVESAKLPVFGICREDRSILVTVEDGAGTALISANVSGAFNDYNYAYSTVVLRNTDNLRMFGNTTQDIYVMEPDAYDINFKVKYTFLTEENKGYAGLANYYRERLVTEGVLTPSGVNGDIPLYYDIIAATRETSHFLGVQYLHTFAMTTFDEAGQISDDLAASGIKSQVMNLQGWFNKGYYHDAPHNIKVIAKLGGRSGLKKLQEVVSGNNGRLYGDVAFQDVTFADNGFSYEMEGSRYYGAGYVVSLGQVNPTTLRNTSALGYGETRYDLISPKFLPRYVQKFAAKVGNIGIDGISLRDLGDELHSDKKRTNIINREEALDVVLAQLDTLEATGKYLMTNSANAYSFAYSTDIINAPVTDNDFPIVDESIPLYEMIIHGSIPYSTGLLNFEDEEDMTETVLMAIEAGAAPHYVFTFDESSKMKNTGLNRFYATTYKTWADEAVSVYNKINDALKYVSGAVMTDHQILDNGVRKVTYDNGVTIYINYDNEAKQADGCEIPAMWYRLEGI